MGGDGSQSLTSHFIRQWIHDTDCFLGLHDRKLCVLGLCTLITAAPSHPGLVEECAQQIVPSLLLLFDGLKRAYAAKAAEEEDDDDDDDDDLSGEEVLSSDEDDIDQDGQDYLDRLQERISNTSGQSPYPITSVIKDLPCEGEDDDDDDDEDDEEEETALEGYTTPLDLDNCEVDEYVVFKQVLEEAGGYNFNQQTVPSCLNFGGGSAGATSPF